MVRLGIFGGTFDPPHLGHLILAQLAVDTLDLAGVWFVPAAAPPHKQEVQITPVAHRLAMLERALVDNDRFLLSRIDVDRPGPHYSIDMLAAARAQRPDAFWCFLVGGDSLRDLPSWHRPGALLQDYVTIAVFRRPGVSYDLDQLEAQIPGLRQRLVFVDAPLIDLSASAIRARVRAGQEIRYLVPEAVREYILAHNLYRAED